MLRAAAGGNLGFTRIVAGKKEDPGVHPLRLIDLEPRC